MTLTPEKSQQTRYSATDLVAFAGKLLSQAGLAMERAQIVAKILVEGDLMGHATHGLQLLSTYLADLETGKMNQKGSPITLADTGAAITWDGQYLPGPWLMIKAFELALTRVAEHPVVTLVIQKSHHIACLAAYLELATAKNLFVLLTCSDPSVRAVAPFGGTVPVYTPNPLAAGIPTEGDPILFDISMSSVAHGVVSRAVRQEQKLPGKWVQDNQGQVTDDPQCCFTDPPGSVLPLGGEMLGYKGFSLGLLVEALTAGLSGHGRSNDPTEWGASVFLQIINPESFGGSLHFLSEMKWLGEACRTNPVKTGAPPVRLPGDRARQLKKEQLACGVNLDPAIIEVLKKQAEKYKIDVPMPVSGDR